MKELTKKSLQKNEAFRAELKRHGIGWRDFMSYGCMSFDYDMETTHEIYIVGMGKFRNIYDYGICVVDIDGEFIKSFPVKEV